MASVMGLTFSTIASAQECDGHINIRSVSYDIEEGASLTMQIGEKTWQVFTAQSLPMTAVEDQQDLIPTLGLPSVIAEIKKDLENGKNFFETGREHYTKYLPPRLAAAYYYFFDLVFCIQGSPLPHKKHKLFQ